MFQAAGPVCFASLGQIHNSGPNALSAFLYLLDCGSSVCLRISSETSPPYRGMGRPLARPATSGRASGALWLLQACQILLGELQE